MICSPRGRKQGLGKALPNKIPRWYNEQKCELWHRGRILLYAPRTSPYPALALRSPHFTLSGSCVLPLLLPSTTDFEICQTAAAIFPSLLPTPPQNPNCQRRRQSFFFHPLLHPAGWLLACLFSRSLTIRENPLFWSRRENFSPRAYGSRAQIGKADAKKPQKKSADRC